MGKQLVGLLRETKGEAMSDNLDITNTGTNAENDSAANAEEIFSAITDKKITLILLMSKVYHCNCLC